MAKFGDILTSLLHLDLRISGDDAKASARGIEEHSVELLEHLGALPSILADHDCVGDAQTVTVGVERLESLLLDVVGDKDSRVLHQLGDVRSLTAWGCRHV